MVRDYVLQFDELRRHIKAQSEVTEKDWHDDVQSRFYNDFIYPLDLAYDKFVKGGQEYIGLGLERLHIELGTLQGQMERLTGNSGVDASYCPLEERRVEKVHDNYLRRSNWHPSPVRWDVQDEGPNPETLNNDEAKEINNEREKSKRDFRETPYSDFRKIL